MKVNFELYLWFKCCLATLGCNLHEGKKFVFKLFLFVYFRYINLFFSKTCFSDQGKNNTWNWNGLPNILEVMQTQYKLPSSGSHWLTFKTHSCLSIEHGEILGYCNRKSYSPHQLSYTSTSTLMRKTIQLLKKCIYTIYEK
jgi:hypothetical protein